MKGTACVRHTPAPYAHAASSGSNFLATARRLLTLTLFCALALWLMGASLALAQDRTLSLYNTHTHERLTVTYKRNGRFVQAGLDQLNRFLRDWRRDEVTRIDPDLFDIVWTVYREVRATEPIHVVSAYRSPATNNMLRRRSSGVAQNSNHTRGQAMDFFIPGVSAADIRAAGLRLQQGGVGYYPRSATPFVHLDTGSVRMWPRMTRDQLSRIFPDGRTVLIPSDGRPLAGYELAQRDLQRGASSRPAAVASASASSDQNDGDGDIVLPGESGGGFLQALFGGGNRPEPPASVPTASAAPAATPASLPAETEIASAPRDRYAAPAPVLPPYASADGTSLAPSTVAGLSVPAPVAAPTIDEIQLAALGTPQPASPPASAGAVALDGAFTAARSAPQPQPLALPAPVGPPGAQPAQAEPTLSQPVFALAATPGALPPISRAEQIAQTVPAPGQIAAIIEARFAEQRAAQASLAGRVSEALETVAAAPQPAQQQGALLAFAQQPAQASQPQTPRFVPPTPVPPTTLVASASAPVVPQVTDANPVAAAFAASEQSRTPGQSAIDILTGSATQQTPSGITGQLYPLADDMTAALAKQSIRGAGHATLIAPSSTVSLSPVVATPGGFVRSSSFQLSVDGFSRSGS